MIMTHFPCWLYLRKIHRSVLLCSKQPQVHHQDSIFWRSIGLHTHFHTCCCSPAEWHTHIALPKWWTLVASTISLGIFMYILVPGSGFRNAASTSYPALFCWCVLRNVLIDEVKVDTDDCTYSHFGCDRREGLLWCNPHQVSSKNLSWSLYRPCPILFCHVHAWFWI